eukprot:gnl/TRDRNA2_/TRDRNA2_41813_c0_seq1.p1 gnl/TRDRNA2_/TRDRNA2_41813_c0~~gnl/TRDRNA2_/TRDRNA2_41813_c0_seq1.p1  ORF type:complete len:467 (+),score=49.56 gnl/TRDRNA2_/TRDRNA2_41813_c0_seq1:100-1500(+)
MIRPGDSYCQLHGESFKDKAVNSGHSFRVRGTVLGGCFVLVAIVASLSITPTDLSVSSHGPAILLGVSSLVRLRSRLEMLHIRQLLVRPCTVQPMGMDQPRRGVFSDGAVHPGFSAALSRQVGLSSSRDVERAEMVATPDSAMFPPRRFDVAPPMEPRDKGSQATEPQQSSQQVEAHASDVRFKTRLSGVVDGQYWLEVLSSSSNPGQIPRPVPRQGSKVGEELKLLLGRVPEDHPADIEVSTIGLQRRLSFSVPGADVATSLDFPDFSEPEQLELGLRLWPASVAAAAWIARLGGTLLEGDVLELGSGIGVFGLAAGAVAAASSSKPCSLMLSDLSSAVVSSLNSSISKNAPWLAGLTSAKATVLDWDAATRPAFVPHALYDYIVTADCIYSVELAAKLVAAIIGHLKDGGKAYLVVALGRVGLREALEALSDHGELVRVSAALLHRSAETSTIYSVELMVFQKA